MVYTSAPGHFSLASLNPTFPLIVSSVSDLVSLLFLEFIQNVPQGLCICCSLDGNTFPWNLPSTSKSPGTLFTTAPCSSFLYSGPPPFPALFQSTPHLLTCAIMVHLCFIDFLFGGLCIVSTTPQNVSSLKIVTSTYVLFFFFPWWIPNNLGQCRAQRTCSVSKERIFCSLYLKQKHFHHFKYETSRKGES